MCFWVVFDCAFSFLNFKFDRIVKITAVIAGKVKRTMMSTMIGRSSEDTVLLSISGSDASKFGDRAPDTRA